MPRKSTAVPPPATPEPALQVRLIDVARACGVSRGAVSRVLLGTGDGQVRVAVATAERIRAAALAMNFVPNRHAQALRGQDSRLIAVIMDWETAPVEHKRVAALQRLAFGRQYQLLIGRAPHFADAATARSFLNGYLELGVEALILMDRLRTPAGAPLALEWERYPHLVCHGEAAQVAGGGGVLPGVGEGSRLAVEHLVRTGRQRIGIALLGGALTRERRLAGFAAGFNAAGRRLDEALVWYPPRVDGSQSLTPALADTLVRTLVVERGCDALIVENDTWGARVLRALQLAGRRVPDDVAVIGYGNLELSECLSPALTTLDERDEELAALLLEQALARVADPRAALGLVEVPPVLVVRESA